MATKKSVKKSVKPKAVKTSSLGSGLKAIAEKETKTQIISALAEETGLTKKQVSSVMDTLANRIFRHMKKNGSGVFIIPQVCMLKRKTKPATKQRPGRNPATGEEITIPAKPARKVVRIMPLSVLKKTATE